MSTKHSPLAHLTAQADHIASTIKRAARGEPIDQRFAQKLAAARAKEVVKIGVVMDDKVITIDLPWKVIHETTEAGLSAWILDLMRETRETAQ